MGFMFCDLHVLSNNPSSWGYKFVEFVLFNLDANTINPDQTVPKGAV